MYHPVTYEAHQDALRYCEVEGGRIAYIDEGEGPVILLIHGIPTSSWLYRHVIVGLSQKGYRVVAPDLLGYGNSDKPEDVEVYSHVRQGERILELMRSLEIEEWYQVVHDAGGIWSWEMFRDTTGPLKGLILLNTIIFREGYRPPVTFQRGNIGEAFCRTYCSPVLSTLMVKNTLNAGMYHHELEEGALHGYAMPLRRGCHSALYYFLTSFEEIYHKMPQYQDTLRKIKVPIGVIWGKRDKVSRASQVDLIRKEFGLRESDIHILKENDHFLTEESPEKIADLIDQLVSSWK